ncbi:phosphotransferase family protein [Streptomyces sp. NBC_00873]|uniref:phosphotransferase family protein n=1 Tax=unclassified Streptomyces TaxID=2593676 RepID=UPI0038680B4C|nr:phosphotransferase family protein [Streptomyces sp. NBC_00873]WTA41986.1 phosphotransferase family protein [Streptomyces sp. NBC_00842]
MTTVPGPATSPPGLELGALEAYFQVHVPGYRGSLRAEVVAGGRSNLTYRVTGGGSTWAVRRPPLGGLTPSAHDIGREHRVTSGLRGSGVAVAEAVAYCDDTDVIGAPFSVAAWVDGRVLRTRADADALTANDLARCSDGLVDQLVRLHAVPYCEFGLETLGRPDGYLRRQLTRWRGQWDLVATRPLPTVGTLFAALEAAMPETGESSIVHGDFRVDNTILDPDDLSRVRAVVDWELSTLGDPLADLATFLVYRDPAVDALLDGPAATAPGFPTQSQLAEQYAQSSGRDITQLPFYLALAYFKVAVIAEGVHSRYTQGITVGSGFDRAGASVSQLIDAGLAAIGGTGAERSPEP